METTILPAQYGLTGAGIKPGQVNYYMWTQATGISATQRSNGQYIDLWSDPATAMMHVADNVNSLPDQSMNQAWGQKVAESFSTQAGIFERPPVDFSVSASGLGADVQGHLNLGPQLFYDPNGNAWQSLGMNAGGFLGYDLYSLSFTGGPPTLIREWNSIQSGGTDWFGDCLGTNTTTGDAFCRGFHFDGTSSANNYMMFRNYGGSTDTVRHYIDGRNESLGQEIFDTTTKNTLLYSAAGTAVPTCNSGSKGTALVVSDATAPTYLGTYTSGGAVVSPALCNGTNWVTY
jgi:hypothetical protein